VADTLANAYSHSGKCYAPDGPRVLVRQADDKAELRVTLWPAIEGELDGTAGVIS
jgi:hypothetical protein